MAVLMPARGYLRGLWNANLSGFAIDRTADGANGIWIPTTLPFSLIKFTNLHAPERCFGGLRSSGEQQIWRLGSCACVWGCSQEAQGKQLRRYIGQIACLLDRHQCISAQLY